MVSLWFAIGSWKWPGDALGKGTKETSQTMEQHFDLSALENSFGGCDAAETKPCIHSLWRTHKQHLPSDYEDFRQCMQCMLTFFPSFSTEECYCSVCSSFAAGSCLRWWWALLLSHIFKHTQWWGCFRHLSCNNSRVCTQVDWDMTLVQTLTIFCRNQIHAVISRWFALVASCSESGIQNAWGGSGYQSISLFYGTVASSSKIYFAKTEKEMSDSQNSQPPR